MGTPQGSDSLSAATHHAEGAGEKQGKRSGRGCLCRSGLTCVLWWVRSHRWLRGLAGRGDPALPPQSGREVGPVLPAPSPLCANRGWGRACPWQWGPAPACRQQCVQDAFAALFFLVPVLGMSSWGAPLVLRSAHRQQPLAALCARKSRVGASADPSRGRAGRCEFGRRERGARITVKAAQGTETCQLCAFRGKSCGTRLTVQEGV